MKTITVKGVGKASVSPDLIVVSMNLETKEKEYDQTMESAATKIELLNQALEQIGFAKNAVKTTGFHVRTDYENVKDEDGTYRTVLKGYVCNHNLKVEFDFDTKRLAQVLSTVSLCMAKPELSVLFTVKDPAAVRTLLLKSAAKNAQKTAKVLCAAAGSKLGEITSIDYHWKDTNASSETDYRIGNRCLAKAACLSSIDITPEDIDVSDEATFTWEIF